MTGLCLTSSQQYPLSVLIVIPFYFLIYYILPYFNLFYFMVSTLEQAFMYEFCAIQAGYNNNNNYYYYYHYEQGWIG